MRLSKPASSMGMFSVLVVVLFLTVNLSPVINDLTNHPSDEVGPYVTTWGTAYSNDLKMQNGSQQYFFVGSNGGCTSLYNMSWNPNLGLRSGYHYTNSGHLNFTTISIGHQSSHNGSYLTRATNYGIAGIGVDNYGSFSAFNASNVGNAGVSLSFNLKQPSLVVLMVGGEGDGHFNITKIVGNAKKSSFTLAVSYTNSKDSFNAIAGGAILYSNLSAGTYNITISGIISPTNDGIGTGAVAYVFTPKPFPSPHPLQVSPSSFIHVVPFSVINNQSVGVSLSFQLKVVMNSSYYSAYEAPNLQNIEFTYPNGTVVPSWLQAGNSKSSSYTVYWLRLAHGIQADSTITLNMDFASLTTNLLNNLTTGESPSLSSLYGEYDDGAQVFGFYDNFAGTSLNSQLWNATNAYVTVADGVTVSPESGVGGLLSQERFHPRTIFDAEITSISKVVDNVGFFNQTAPAPLGGQTFQGTFIREACGNTYPDQWNANGEANGCGGVYGALTDSEGIQGLYQVDLLNSTSSISYLNGGLGSSHQPISTNAPSYPLSAGLVGSEGNLIEASWILVRAAPPNGVMPLIKGLSSGQLHFYNVTFKEVGLSPGTVWSAQLGPMANQSSGASLNLGPISGGTYGFIINPVDGYASSPESGYVSVETSINKTISFAPVTSSCDPPRVGMDTPIIENNVSVTITGSTAPGGPNCTISQVNWQWGDGSTSSTIFPGTHVYLFDGEYWVIATSVQSDGQVASAMESVTITGAPPVGNITVQVTPTSNTSILIDGNLVATGLSPFTVRIGYGLHNIVAYNPYENYNSTEFDLASPHGYVNLTLAPGTGVPGQYYPWDPIGPYKLLLGPPMVPPNGSAQASSGHVGTMAIDYSNPNVMYVGTGSSAYPTYGPYGDDGIYKTINGGVTWYPVDFGLPLDIVTSLLMNQSNPQQLLAGFWDAGIYETMDGGGYWYKVANYTLVSGLIDINGTFFAGTGNDPNGNGGSVVEGTSFGSHWKTVLSTPQEVISVSGVDGVIYAAAGSLWKSTDLGKSWAQLSNLPYEVQSVSVSPANPKILYVCPLTGSQLPYYSSNAGVSFSAVPALNGFDRQIVFDPANTQIIWAEGVYEARISRDGGNTWVNPFPSPMGTPVGDIHTAYFVPTENGTIFELSDQGIFQSNDYGRNWYSDNGNLEDFLIYSFGISDSGSQIILSMQDYGGPQTHNGGQSWSWGNLSGSYGISEGEIVYTNPFNSSWAYAFNPGGQTLLVSNNGGLTFTQVLDLSTVSYYGFPFMFNSLFATSSMNASRVYVGTLLGVYIGTDYGTHWALWPGSPSNVSSIWTSPNGTIFVSWGGGYLSYYLDGSWHTSIGVNFAVSSMAFDPAQSGRVMITSNQGPSGGLYVSNDGGESFTLFNADPIHFPFPPPPGEGYGPAPLQIFYLNTTGYPLLAITGEGIYLSLNGGNTWTSIEYNLHVGQVTWAAFTNDTLYISTYGEGVLALRNFSVRTLPGTIEGNYSSVQDLNVTLSGKAISSPDGRFQVFVPPGQYTISLSWTGGHRELNLTVSPMHVIYLNYSARSSSTYVTTFTESGLPSGTTWYMNLTDGLSFSSTTTTISFSELNGTYSYTVATNDKTYEPSPASGSFPVNGTSVSKSVTFSEVTYTATFTETGLPSGTWYVNLTNGMKSGVITGSSYTLDLTNGSYSYTIATSDKTYTPSPYSSSFTVNGASVPVSIAFSKVQYTVKFTESGLTSGTIWYVNLSNGQSFKSTTSTISFNEPNGTYSYTIGNASGYTVSPSSGSLNVSGSNATKAITFTVASTPSKLSSTELCGIIGAVAAVAVIGTALAIMRKRR